MFDDGVVFVRDCEDLPLLVVVVASLLLLLFLLLLLLGLNKNLFII